MRRKLFQKIVCMILSVTTLLGALGITSLAAKDNLGNSTVAPSIQEMQSVSGIVPYATYIARYEISGNEAEYVVFDALMSNWIAGSSEDTLVKDSDDAKDWEDAAVWPGYKDLDPNGDAIYLSSGGSVTWQFSFDTTMGGLYNIVIEYYSCNTDQSSMSSIERKLLINDAIPFKEVSSVTFDKFWTYDNIDNNPDPNVRDDDRADGIYYDYVLVDEGEIADQGYYKYKVEVKNKKATTLAVYHISQDINGNSMAPGMDVEPQWSSYYVSDASGYYDEPLSFYFAPNQTHSITLESIREPMVIKSIKLVPTTSEVIDIPSYEEYRDKYSDKTAASGGSIVKIETEFPDYVSDSAVAPSNDKSSAATYPTDASAQLYNIIGKKSYNAVGQWAAYKFEVTESGFYKLGMRYKQDSLQGMYICRAIKLSGGIYGDVPEAPFEEAYDVRFNYDKTWQSNYLGMYYDVEDQEELGFEAFEFYFEEGEEYTVYVECSLGSLREQIMKVENALNRVNDAYLQIIQLTGSDPDEYRDYGFISAMPEVLVTILEEAQVLMEVKNELERLCGTNGSHIATLETVALSFNKTASNDGYDVAANLESMKSYLGTLGTWVNSSKTASMVMDSLTLVPADKDETALPRASANFFSSLWFEIKSFFYSFFTDYDQMGLVTVPTEDTTTIDVWLDKGRDQSQIWRTMVDAYGGFTHSTNIAVTLKLVAGGTLLPSILSGKGPDVYMELDSGTVMNYAIRNAIVGVGTSSDKAEFSEEQERVFNNTYYCYTLENGGYEDLAAPRANDEADFVSESYNDVLYNDQGEQIYVDAALDTIRLLDVYYGVPMTMSFSMMFYRMDVLADLEQAIPKTWEDMLAMLPALQSNSMSIGVNYILAIDFMIYQKGGSMWKYTDSSVYDSIWAGAKIDLDSDIALEAFEEVCKFFTDHSFPVSYDAANRFRTGEMPVLIGDYIGLYNNLVVFATEIEGLWGFCPLPGVEREDGTVNYDSLASVRATVMLYGCDDMAAAWKFMQWQTSSRVQSEYGNGMVAIIGPSAKYEAANIDAINDLSWTAKELQAINDQIENMSSIVNYPGSYIIGRYTKFAFLNAVNDGKSPVTAIQDYIEAINSEITRKREEFQTAEDYPLGTLAPDEEAPKK